MNKIHYFLGIALLIVILLGFSYLLTKSRIEKSLIEICDAASAEYDCLPRKALLFQLSDNTIDSIRMKETVWAIGKMKIDAALPKLEQMYEQANNSAYQYSNCKYELKKAIAYLKKTKVDIMSFRKLYNQNNRLNAQER